MRVMVRGMFLGGSWIGTMKVNIAFFVIKRKLPSIQGAFLGGLEERPKHPVSSAGLQDRMHDKSACEKDQHSAVISFKAGLPC